jgi:ADP-heptose:LPS heptosyltransferase
LGLLGIYNIDKRPELWTSTEDEEWADRFLEAHWVKDLTKLVAISIGSSRRWVTKLWPIEYFADVANALARDFGIRIVLIGSENRDSRTEAFLKRTRCKPINALGKTNIPRLAALLKRCSVMIGSDSAPLHVAASVNTPFVGLFGPTDPKRHLAPTEKSVVFQRDFKCSPCYKTHCQRDYKCMKSIRPDEIYQAVVKLLGMKPLLRVPKFRGEAISK